MSQSSPHRGALELWEVGQQTKVVLLGLGSREYQQRPPDLLGHSSSARAWSEVSPLPTPLPHPWASYSHMELVALVLPRAHLDRLPITFSPFGD